MEQVSFSAVCYQSILCVFLDIKALSVLFLIFVVILRSHEWLALKQEIRSGCIHITIIQQLQSFKTSE